MGFYRKKPVTIEAVQWDGMKVADIAEFMRAERVSIRDGGIEIDTLEGTMRADPGDWIIKGVKGEFYPCKPDIFEATYEPVDAPEPRG